MVDPAAICGTLAVGIMMMYALHRKQNQGYSCPSCGTKEGQKHSPNCSWKKFYD